MDEYDEARTLRRRTQELEKIQSSFALQPNSATLIGQVVDAGAMPNTVPNQFCLNPTRVTGKIIENVGTVGLSNGSANTVFTHLGPRIPSVGDYVLCRHVGGRWVTGVGGAAIPPGNTTIAGKLEGGCSTFLGIPGTITIKNGGTTLWSGSTASNGTFTSGSFFLSGTTSLNVTGTPTSSRNTAHTRTFTANIGVNTGCLVVAPAATGYVATNICGLAINKNLTLTSSGVCGPTSWPSDTLVFQSISSCLATWNGSAVVSYNPGTGYANYNYKFSINALGDTGIDLVPVGGGGAIFIADPIFDGCPESSPDFSCHTICATQNIGVTIHD